MSDIFADVRALASTKYFVEERDGILHLRDGVAEKIIDFHTHLGWGLLNQSVHKLGDTVFPYVNFPIDLDHYSAHDFDKILKKRATRKTLKAVFSKGKYKNTSASHLLLEMNALKVEKSVTLAVDIIGSVNSNIVLNTCQKEPSRFVPFVSLHPKNKKNESVLKRYVEHGAVGIKIHPAMQRIYPNCEFVRLTAEMAKKYNIPVIFHCGESPLTPKTMKKYTRMKDYEEIVSQCRETTFILGHSGIDEWEKAAEIARLNENVYLELSGQPPKVIKYFIKKVGFERLLFGSDWPYYPVLFPLAKVLLATEDDLKAREGILFGNAKRLLRL